MLPAVDQGTGHLPPGRFRSTLPELQARFVDAPEFATSSTRQRLWEGLNEYLYAWRAAEDDLGVRVLRGLWLGGSFVSATLDPSDIDVSPIYDREALDACSGRPGRKKIKQLVGHRDRVRKVFNVEPFPMRYRAIPSTLHAEALVPLDREILAVRGGLDDWWQRIRPPGPKGPPTEPRVIAERGYVEVEA